MLRRRYYPKKEAAGEAERGKKADAPVRYGAGSQRSVPRCAEDGFVARPLRAPAETTVCFTGHRILSAAERASLSSALCHLIPYLYTQGYRTFLSGGALGFDLLAAQAVLRCRDSLPGLRLNMVLPCRGQSARWSAADQQVYQQVLRQADEVLWLSETYYQGCMHMRNQFLVAHSSLCVCFLRSRGGGTAYTVALAFRKGLKIHNLALGSEG